MAVLKIKGPGVPRAKGKCDECSREEILSCDYVRGNSGSWTPNEGQMHAKLVGHGWELFKGALLCPKCKAERKVVKMNPASAPKEAEAEAPPEPTRPQKRAIMDLLEEVYDTKSECYRRGDTDDTIAAVLEVRPGWVSKLREEFFGPAGNEDMGKLQDDLNALSDMLTAAVRQATDDLGKLRSGLGEVEKMQARLSGIEVAVGARVMSRVK
jgi:uncharacterized Zn finger protein (UPF0148 family)